MQTCDLMYEEMNPEGNFFHVFHSRHKYRVCTRVGLAVVDYAVLCAYILNMRIICILIYAVYADMRIMAMRMSFPNRICKCIYQQMHGPYL